jgi:hypothetical protein
MVTTRIRMQYFCTHTAQDGTRCQRTIQHWTLTFYRRHYNILGDGREIIDAPANNDNTLPGREFIRVQLCNRHVRNDAPANNDNMLPTMTTRTTTAGAIPAPIPLLLPPLKVNNVGQANLGCEQHMSMTTMMTAIAIAVPIPPIPSSAVIQPALPWAHNNGQNDVLPRIITVPMSSHLHNELQIWDNRINALESAVKQLRSQLNDLQEQMRTQQTSAVNRMPTITKIELAFQEGCTGSPDDDATRDMSLNTALERKMNEHIIEARSRGRVNNSPRLSQCANENTSPETQYHSKDFNTPQRSNAHCIANDGCNAGLVNNDVVCFANAILQIIASCGHLNEALSNPPSIEHQHFSLYYNFANVISSMIKGKNEVVDPGIFMDAFSDHFSQFNADQRKYSVIINVFF